VDTLENVAWERAIEGSDRLLQFLLAAHRPEVYSHRARVEHSGPDGAAIPLALVDLVLSDRTTRFPEAYDGEETENSFGNSRVIDPNAGL
jgi:hypothetical protein